jgi:hypothetical protein
MKKWHASALVIALLLVVGLSTFGQKKNQPKIIWEYKVTGSPGSTEQTLNQLGLQGWELVSVDQDGTVFYLKRAK